YSDLLLHDMGDLLQAPAPAPAGTLIRSMSRLRIPSFNSGANPSSRRVLSVSGPTAGYYGSPSSATPVPYPMETPLEPIFPRGPVPKELLNTQDPQKLTWDAMQREWRTPPLWGVADSAPYLHDGRAETLDAAIRWHGGEAADAAANYRTLTEPDREKVIAFLSSLRAPVVARQIPEPVQTVVRSTADKSTPHSPELSNAIDLFQQGYANN
ncbi:MAG: hypothetical protein MI861_01535, partial [Pirellulales bacterium]|nr:hypothetical protein [Pirellulales bacterium]